MGVFLKFVMLQLRRTIGISISIRILLSILGLLRYFFGGCFYLFLDVRLEVLKSGTSFVLDRTLFEKDSQAVISFSQNMILSQNKNICNFQVSCKFPNFKISELR